jgi:hypothetical protein
MPTSCRCIAFLTIALAVVLGCAAKQRIALHCVPSEVTVYVDGRELGEAPDSIALRSDEPHTIFFKGAGYRPQMVVLNSWEEDGRKRLSPTDLCAEVAFVPMRPEVHMEIDPQVSEDAP